MTNQQTDQPLCPQYREDYKVKKLVERMEAKLALQAKETRESDKKKIA